MKKDNKMIFELFMNNILDIAFIILILYSILLLYKKRNKLLNIVFPKGNMELNKGKTEE